MIRRAVLVCAALLAPAAVWAHAFPDHTEPRVGSSVAAPPAQVRIWFDGAIEPVFSTLRVEDAEKRPVAKNDERVNPTDRPLLEVGLPPIPAGRYRVFWSVVARDGHRTEGSFAFRVK